MSESDALRPEEMAEIGLSLGDSSFDDDLLLMRLKNVIYGDVHPDPEGETADEQSKLVLATILRQLRNNCASRAALGYLAYCLERYLSGETATLDAAFYVKHKGRAGGQAVPEEVERATVRAYMNVIRPATREYDPSIEDWIYFRPSRAIRREAEMAAYTAYRKATGKDMVEDHEPEKKINQTIKPILRRKNVLR